MSFSLISNIFGVGQLTFTTSSIDTTGATLLVAHVSSFAVTAEPTLTDSKGNTWIGLTAQVEGGTSRSRLFYAANPSVGTGHTFTLTDPGGNIFAGLEVQAWSGASITLPFDVENGGTQSSGTSLATGSVTPSVNNELVVTGAHIHTTGSGTISIDSGFSISDQDQGGAVPARFASAMAYLVQSTAGAVNPSWSWSTTTSAAATIATFKAATASAFNAGWANATHIVGGAF